MPTKKANAEWKGDLKSGKGTIELESGAYKGSYSFASRFENGSGSNPEELIGGAIAGCFSMAFANDLSGEGYKPESVKTDADVTLEMVDNVPTVTTIRLLVEASVPDIDEDEFQKLAESSKKNCPVSRALEGVSILLDASLKN